MTVAPGRPPPDGDLTARVLGALRAAGLSGAGVAVAERFRSTQRDLEERRAAGLHGGMAFTYRNPRRSTDPGRVLDGARSIVVGALGYRVEEPLSGAGDGKPAPVAVGRVARYAWRDFYADLGAALGAGLDLLRSDGHHAVVVIDDNGLVDREAARRAGIGWYGRNANLLVPGLGSWFVLGSIVTDAALVPSPEVAPGCGSCTRCQPACPTGAIVEAGVVDARRCLAWLLQDTGPFPWEWRVALGDRIYGCDDCQEVCPPNRLADRRVGVEVAVTLRPSIDVMELLDADDDAVVRAAGRWYVPRREARYLRRNALVVLGNAADPDDSRVRGILGRFLTDPDPIVRGHAVWAAARLGRPDLADALAVTEADPMVVEELNRRGAVVSRATGAAAAT